MSQNLQSPENQPPQKSQESKNSRPQSEQLRSINSRPKKFFTGFVAHYSDGRSVRERENYFSKTQNKMCATNWSEIEKDQLVALELFWNDQSKIIIYKKDYPSINVGDWYFSHSGCLDMHSRKIVVVSRNIGYIHDGLLHMFVVSEKTGTVRSHTRAV